MPREVKREELVYIQGKKDDRCLDMLLTIKEVEKAIARASKYSLFEFNDEFTRAQFIALVNPYLRDVQGRRGIFDFKVVCDTTNNTPEVIDRNEFVGDIYIKPARSINYIQLNFVAVRTGVAFEEIVGRF